jgi:hypothetical protein
MDSPCSGPNREFRAPPQCIIAPLASSPTTSTFKFKIDPAPVRRANMRGMRYVELTQTCSRWRETMAGSRGSGNDALNDMVTQGQLASLAAREDVKLRTNVPLHLHDHSFKVSLERSSESSPATRPFLLTHSTPIIFRSPQDRAQLITPSPPTRSPCVIPKDVVDGLRSPETSVLTSTARTRGIRVVDRSRWTIRTHGPFSIGPDHRIRNSHRNGCF